MNMNVLSLFDGMSCGQIALNRVGIEYDKYFASEIEKNSIKVTQHNFPNTIQLGDVTKIEASDLPQIDLIMGGFTLPIFFICRQTKRHVNKGSEGNFIIGIIS